MAAVVKIAAARFVRRPMPCKQIAKVIGTIPALKKERRIAIVIPEYAFITMARIENRMAHKYRSNRVQRALTKYSHSAVRRQPAATAEFLIAESP